MKRIKPVLVYIAGTSPNSEEEKFLDGLGKAYALRNSQFFLEVEDFDEVYNLSKISKINESYGDRMVEDKPKTAKAEPKAETKEEPKTQPTKAAPKRKARTAKTGG